MITWKTHCGLKFHFGQIEFHHDHCICSSQNFTSYYWSNLSSGITLHAQNVEYLIVISCIVLRKFSFTFPNLPEISIQRHPSASIPEGSAAPPVFLQRLLPFLSLYFHRQEDVLLGEYSTSYWTLSSALEALGCFCCSDSNVLSLSGNILSFFDIFKNLKSLY